MPYTPPPDAYGVANNCDPATVDYFIEVFGFNEALELSRLEDPTANTINYQRIQVALNDSATLINNFIETAPPQGETSHCRVLSPHASDSGEMVLGYPQAPTTSRRSRRGGPEAT